MADSPTEEFNHVIKVAKLSFITLLGIGIGEVITGYITNSTVLFADGIDSIGDSLISLIVLIGLLFFNKKPDSKFRFGYYKVESLAALFVAIGMSGMGIIISYTAIHKLLEPTNIIHSEIVILALAIASFLSGYRSYRLNKVAKRYKLLSLNLDAKNSIKDTLSSIIGLISALLAIFTGFVQLDSIGALAIAAFIFSISYIALRESSLILLDVVKEDIVEQIITFIQTTYKVNVSNLLLRPLGPYLHGELTISLDNKMTIEEFNKISKDISKGVKKKFPKLKRLVITVEPKY